LIAVLCVDDEERPRKRIVREIRKFYLQIIIEAAINGEKALEIINLGLLFFYKKVTICRNLVPQRF